MSKSYLNLVTKSQVIKESEETPKESLKDAITTFAANLGSEVNIYEALRKFIEKYTEDIDRKAELLDTIEFCEADEADLESTLIKLKIAMDNPVLSEAIADTMSTTELAADTIAAKSNFIDRDPEETPRRPLSSIQFKNIKSVKQALGANPFNRIVHMFKNGTSIQKIESSLLSLQNSFYNGPETLDSETIKIVEDTFEYLWNKFDRFSSKQIANTEESLIMINKDFLITESDVTKAVKTNKNDTPRKELDPVRCFVVLDKNDMPMLNKGGIVITNTPDAEQQIQQRADDLYRLIHNAKAVYVIEDEAYDKCVDIRDKKEYVRFVKANGRLIKASEAGKAIETHDLDDDDFLLNVEEMFE